MSDDNVTPLFSEIPDTIEELTSPQLVDPDAPETPVVYNAILKVWRTMLMPENQRRERPPTPDWCAIIIARWPFLRFSDCGVVQREYFAVLDVAREILEQVYLDFPEAFDDVDSRDKDVENKELYVFVLKEWQRALLVIQDEWSYDDPEAGPKMAALGEAQQQLLGDKSMASYLAYIDLPFTNEEQKDMTDEMQAFRDELEV